MVESWTDEVKIKRSVVGPNLLRKEIWNFEERILNKKSQWLIHLQNIERFALARFLGKQTMQLGEGMELISGEVK